MISLFKAAFFRSEVGSTEKPNSRLISSAYALDAFSDLLPPEILHRQKEQFSDGVGYGWIDALKRHATGSVSDSDLEAAAFRFPVNTPATKEGYLYRSIFESHFPGPSAAALVPGGDSVACSTPEAS